MHYEKTTNGFQKCFAQKGIFNSTKLNFYKMTTSKHLHKLVYIKFLISGNKSFFGKHKIMSFLLSTYFLLLTVYKDVPDDGLCIFAM